MHLLIGDTVDQLTVCAVIQFRHEAQSAHREASSRPGTCRSRTTESSALACAEPTIPEIFAKAVLALVVEILGQQDELGIGLDAQLRRILPQVLNG